MREAGRRVYVQPLARVVHVEGATAGSDPRAGIKRFQAVNRAKFAERWERRLRAAPEPVPFGTARFVLPGQRRILIVDHVVPAIDEDAGSVILVETILLLQRLGYLVVFGAQRTPDRRDRKVMALERLGVEVIRAPYYRSVVEYIAVHEGQLDRCSWCATRSPSRSCRSSTGSPHADDPAQSRPALSAHGARSRDPR